MEVLEEEGEFCNTSLALAIGTTSSITGGRQLLHRGSENTTLQFHAVFPHHHHLKEEEEEEEVISTGKETSKYCSNNGGSRKKLKLTKEQTEKQDLADRLHIQPRQVEVWFQNKRARTKVKQIEVDYESLKRCCERLIDENRRLKKELQELKSATREIALLHAANFPGGDAGHHHLPSCERMAAAGKSMSRLAVPPVNTTRLLLGARRN
ncbi:hypothetical protein Cni_G27100 [Canna indica]|uniref:Homeobox domain-containing protein n=1 Tax=Canna indica TaxID=4628 RepID=A0AAQ3QMN1_9LILI|nr:hypothetical protein Cni_G27100 [Canna indica]